jgi:hypothetical protein
MCGKTQRTPKNKTIKKHKQIKFYKVIAAPLLMYESENRTLNRSERGKIEVLEMPF